MKESSWADCLENNVARKVSIDVERAKSLIETANDRISVITTVNQKNCNFVFEDYYTSIIESLQAILINKGFNISNHLCLGVYLKEVLLREDLFIIFDDLRYKRNGLIYYGNKMEFEIALDALKKSKMLLKELKLLSFTASNN